MAPIANDGLNDRLREVRRALGLSQKAFGEGIRLKSNTIANYEMGNRTPGSAVLELLRVSYGVNIDWLLTGEGEMFDTPPEPEPDYVGLLIKKYKLLPGMRMIIEPLLQMDTEKQRHLIDLMKYQVEAMSSAMMLSQPATPRDLTEEEAVEMVRRQYREEKEADAASSQGQQAG